MDDDKGGPAAPPSSRAAILASSRIHLLFAAAAAEGAARPAAAAVGGRLLTVGGCGGKRVRVVPGGGGGGGGGGEAYPARTDQWCWYCCHPFETPPLPMPIKYDDRRDIFHVMGTFCSFPCIKAYNLESSSYLKHVNINHITLFHKRCTGRLRGIRAAPPRVALRVFGGHMSIDEFRRAADSPLELCVLPPRMIVHSQVLHEIDASQKRHHAAAQRKAPPDLAAVVNFKDAAAKNETLRLKRPKPLQSSTRNLLERSMGISAFGGLLAQQQQQQPPPGG